MFINDSIYKDNLNDDLIFDPVKLSPIRIPPYKEEDDDIEAQFIIKIKRDEQYSINNLIINFLLFILSFLTFIIPNYTKKNVT